jgi:hypothetical protein
MKFFILFFLVCALGLAIYLLSSCFTDYKDIFYFDSL